MPEPTSTFGLLERFRGGDQEAFRLLYEKYRRRLALLIFYKMSEGLRERVEVDDILQEVFWEAANGMGRFSYQSPGSFLRWLSRIADTVIIDAARFESRQKRDAREMLRFRSPSNPGGAEALDSRSPSRVFAQDEAVRRLLEKLSALPEEYRQVILLTKVQGLTTAEVAEELGKSREAVALLLHRGLQRLRADLYEDTRGKARIPDPGRSQK